MNIQPSAATQAFLVWEEWIEMIMAALRAGLDACYARLYGHTRDELRYMPFGVDPKEVYGEDPSTSSGQVSLGRHSVC